MIKGVSVYTSVKNLHRRNLLEIAEDRLTAARVQVKRVCFRAGPH